MSSEGYSPRGLRRRKRGKQSEMSAGAWSSQARGVSRQRISAGGAGGCEICRCGGSGRAAVAEAPPAPRAGGLAPRGPARPRGVIRRASPAAIPRALRRLGLRRSVAFSGGAGPGRPRAHFPRPGSRPAGFQWCAVAGRPAPGAGTLAAKVARRPRDPGAVAPAGSPGEPGSGLTLPTPAWTFGVLTPPSF